MVAQVGAFGTTDAKVIVGGLGIGSDRGVPRNADRNKTVVGKLRRRAVAPTFAHMTMRTIPLRGILERLQPARLSRRQHTLARQIGVVLAAVRIEAGWILLECFQGRG